MSNVFPFSGVNFFLVLYFEFSVNQKHAHKHDMFSKNVFVPSSCLLKSAFKTDNFQDLFLINPND